jgi:hypothetical protein
VGGKVVEVGGVLGLLFVFSLLSLFVVVFFFSCLICSNLCNAVRGHH